MHPHKCAGWRVWHSYPRPRHPAQASRALPSAQGGVGWSVMLGTGLVVARARAGGSRFWGGRGGVGARARDGWSPPSALGLCGFGWGLQAGGALCDVLIVLRSRCARRLVAGRGPAGWPRRLM